MSSPLPPDHAERERALDLTINALAIAPAGSGKTSLLVARALKCLAVSREPEEVVAITFTNKAAAEIRARLVEALQLATRPLPADANPHAQLMHQLARQVLDHAKARDWQLLENPNRLRALTIDALNADLASRLPLLSGLGGPTTMTEDSRGLFAEAIQALFAELEDPALGAETRDALALVLRAEDNRLDRLLNPLSDMLEKREQWLGEILSQGDPTRDAELLGALLQSRLQALDQLLDNSSKQALCATLLEGSQQSEHLAWAATLTNWPPAEASRLDDWRHLASCLVTASQGTLRKRITRNEGFLPKAAYTEQMKALLRKLEEDPRKDAIESACVAVINCPDAEYPAHLHRQRNALAHVLWRLSAHLRVIFSQRGEADFIEVAMAALKAVSGESGYSDVLGRADTRIHHLLVDEMQDTSESQVELLKRLTSGWVPGDGHSLFMVGDPQQSIYAFRKAEVRLFLQLWNTRKLGDVTLERIQLSTNFRSRPALINWLNRRFGALFPPESDVYAGAVAYNPCAAPAQATDPKDMPAVSIHACVKDDGQSEAEAIARRVTELLQSDGTIAILARSRSQLRRTLAELRRRDLPYSCQDIDPLQDVPAVRDYLYLLRALWHPQDRLAWAVVLRSPLVGMSYADLVQLSRGSPRLSWPEKITRSLAETGKLSAEGQQRLEYFNTVLASAEQDPLLYGDLPARAEALWHALGGPACVSRQELEDVRRAMLHARAAAANGEIDSLTTLERSLAQLYATPSDGRVQVLTAHKSKGLEFDHVLLVGCGNSTRGEDQPVLHYHRTPEGVLLVPQPPDSLPEDDPAHRLYAFVQGLHRQAAHNELLRLLYVCCTRARSSLNLFMSLDLKNEDAQPLAGSFARLLWPVIKSDCEAPPPASNETDQSSLQAPPLSPRLPVDYRFVADDPAFRPRERRSLRPSEAALDAQETKTRDGDLYAQLVGVMYHEAMRRMARDGLDAWRDGGHSRSTSMASGFRHLGLPEPQVDEAVAHVLRLLGSTLASRHVEWLLAPHEWAQTEYVLAGYRDSQWISAIVDRCFEDKGRVWVIDYKTSTETADVAREQYGEQLRLYAELLSNLRSKPVSAALFMAASGELVQVC